MKFSADTLHSTARQFEKVLAARELGLPFQKTMSVWTRIVVGKNYSAASSQAKSQGHINAGTITSQSICSVLAEVSRPVEPSAAMEIFSEALVADLAAVSYSLDALHNWLVELPSYKLLPLEGDKVARLGLMDSDHAGYIPVGTIDFLQGRDDELAWMRDNADFVASFLNRLAGRSEGDCDEILLANLRATFKQEDKAFASFIAASEEVISVAVGNQISSVVASKYFESIDRYDYDAIRCTVFDVFVHLIHQDPTRWLKPDCGLAEVVIDHISGRIREDIQLIADGTLPKEDRLALSKLFADSTRRALRRFSTTEN